VTAFTRDDAYLALHMRESFDYEIQAQSAARPGYVTYECPKCGMWHNAYDSPRLQMFLNMFFTPGVFRAKVAA
jgi:hypothetical protein